MSLAIEFMNEANGLRERVKALRTENAALTSEAKRKDGAWENEKRLMINNSNEAIEFEWMKSKQLTAERDALKAENERLREGLTEIASLTQTTKLLWWQKRARTALAPQPLQEKPECSSTAFDAETECCLSCGLRH